MEFGFSEEKHTDFSVRHSNEISFRHSKRKVRRQSPCPAEGSWTVMGLYLILCREGLPVDATGINYCGIDTETMGPARFLTINRVRK